MSLQKHRNKPTVKQQSRHNTMSIKTKDFIQKICYKKTASVDMTKHGFINDNKMYAVNLLLRPLREKLQNICGKRTEDILTQRKQMKSSTIRKHNAGSKITRTQSLNEGCAKLKNNKLHKKGRKDEGIFPKLTMCLDLLLNPGESWLNFNLDTVKDLLDSGSGSRTMLSGVANSAKSRVVSLLFRRHMNKLKNK